jgi:hypothetical protein
MQKFTEELLVESLTKRFLAAVKAFLVNLITQSEWDRLGLEKTWRYFLPLIVIVGLWVLYYLSFWVAGILHPYVIAAALNVFHCKNYFLIFYISIPIFFLALALSIPTLAFAIPT